jgi:type I restriction enzyme, R subunit
MSFLLYPKYKDSGSNGSANHVIKGKLLETQPLRQQAASNTKEQFANSPDLKTELLNAILSALDAHTNMSTKAPNSRSVQSGLEDILLNHSKLWETLRSRGPVSNLPVP